MGSEKNGDFYLVLFDDGIWSVTSKTRIKNICGKRCMAKWPPDGKWYGATIKARGGKTSMNSAKISYENKEIVGQNDKLSQEGNVAYGSYREVEYAEVSNSKNIPIKRSWRKFCNVDMSEVEKCKESAEDVLTDAKNCQVRNVIEQEDLLEPVTKVKILSNIIIPVTPSISQENMRTVPLLSLIDKPLSQVDTENIASTYSTNFSEKRLFESPVKMISLDVLNSKIDDEKLVDEWNMNSENYYTDFPICSDEKRNKLDFFENNNISTKICSGEVSEYTLEASPSSQSDEANRVKVSQIQHSPRKNNAADYSHIHGCTDNIDDVEVTNDYDINIPVCTDREPNNLDYDISDKSFSEEVSEYIPETSPSSQSDEIKIKSKNNQKQHDPDKNDNGEVRNFIQPSIDNVNELPILSVDVTLKNPNNKVKRNKKFYCLFCKKNVSKLPRHLFQKHGNEPEVSKILLLEKHSAERKKLLQYIQNCGAYIKNTDSIKAGHGIIIPKRRPLCASGKDIRNYLPCTYCFQMITTSYLSRHRSICSFKPLLEAPTRNRSLRAQSYLMLPIGPKVSDRFKECILSRMTNDDIYKTIKGDWLITLYGEGEFRRLGYDVRYHRTIIERCRELARLLLAAKTIDSNVKKLNQLLLPCRYKLVRDSVLQVAGFCQVTNTFEAPSLALKLGFSIKKCLSVMKGEYLEDDILRQRVPELDIFLSLMEAKWNTEVAAHAHRTLKERKWNLPKRMPLTKDIQVLHNYLIQRCQILRAQIEHDCRVEAFEELMEITLIMTIILNRRRVGEVQFMEIQDYLKAKSCDDESDIFNCLSEAEKKLSKSLVRLVIKGKKGRGVPVLLTKNLKENIELLNNNRNKCGIDGNNKYLFASCRNVNGHYRAHILLKKYAKIAGCQNIDTITSTKLRKHIAVTVQLLNLKEHELDSLAQFMGHNIHVHRQYYRLEEETVQLAKISKILINMESGGLSEMKGKNLDEIDVNDFINEHEQEQEDIEEIDFDEKKVLRIDDDSRKEEQFGINSVNIIQQDRSNVADNVPTFQKAKRKPWTPMENKIVIEHFKNFLDSKTLPGKKKIDEFLSTNKNLTRSWKNVKDFLYNKIKNLKKI